MVWMKVLVITAALCAGGVSAQIQRIIHGDNVTIEDFPYQASLRRRGAHFCGASIISQRHVITAGHCIIGSMVPPFAFYRVATGTNTRDNQGRLHRIAKVTVHPKFWTDYNRAVNDIAIITLKDDIVFDEYQQKVNLPEQNFKVGDIVNITGWGLINQILSVRPKQLQKIEAEMISKENCQNYLSENIQIYDTEVCTSRKEAFGVCSGDSGGPMVANGELVGIVSWSNGLYCASDNPDVFTNVYKFKNFIKSAMD